MWKRLVAVEDLSALVKQRAIFKYSCILNNVAVK